LENVIRQSIAKWIYKYAIQQEKYKPFVNEITRIINIIIDKDYLKLSLNEINKDTVQKLLGNHTLTQIEPNPQQLDYTSVHSPEFVHYLYQINYYSDGKY